tara:strand:+ start:1552 stop:3135 length:1584 start_codon:yes stop_codon:yes gene_type:complete
MIKKPKARIRLRTILLLVNIMVLLLPLAGLWFFRIYENMLVQQTENELISQAAVISVMYKRHLRDYIPEGESYGVAVDPLSINNVDEYYTPISPQLDLSKTTILPPRGEGAIGRDAAPYALAAGDILASVIGDIQKTTLSGIKVLDYAGVVVAGRTEIGQDFSFLPEVRRAMQGYYTSVIRERISDNPAPALASISRGTGIRVFIAVPIIENEHVWGVVYISRTPQNILKHIYAEKEKTLFAAFILVCMTLVIALLTSYTISRPIRKLINRTERFASGDSTALDDKHLTGVQEIELLYESFGHMAKSLNERSDYIRDFAMHVSHEFKTPITGIQGSAELMLDHLEDMERSKKKKFLSNIIADCDRLKKLVTRLLELARADNPSAKDEHCHVYDVLEKVRGAFSAVKNFEVLLKGEPDFIAKISSENLETICINLCDNAYQNGASRLEVNIKRCDAEIIIAFADDGNGISDANKSKIFTPFFTTRRQEGGTGMGLGIVSSILNAHEGAIDLIDADMGTIFEVRLKLHK